MVKESLAKKAEKKTIQDAIKKKNQAENKAIKLAAKKKS